MLIALAILEGIFVLMLHVPRLTAVSPLPLRRLVQQVYRHFNRTLIQFDRSCARYDPQVTYTLKPGTCVFENIEFRNTYRINRTGLRDDESSLLAPEVIVLGDSHAMGWGVEQDETFPKILERRTGMRVLDAAVSSYGTVREMTLLDRLDTSRLRVLIIQYSDNDMPENRTFREQGRLPITSEAKYDGFVQYYSSQQSYYPGKYAYRLFMKVFRLEEPEPDQVRMVPLTPAEEAEVFINAVAHAGHARLDGVQLVVLEVNEQIRPPRPFIAALDEVRRREGNPEFVRRLKTFDAASHLSPEDFYVLDDHMRPHGHLAIGDALAVAIRALRD